MLPGIARKDLGSWVEPIQARSQAEPERSRAVFMNGANAATLHSVGSTWFRRVVHEAVRLIVESAQDAAPRPEPERAGAIAMNCRDGVCQARGIVSARSIVGKSLGSGIEAADAPELSHPQLAAPIFIDTDDVIRHQAVRISGIVGVMLETTVPLIEPIEPGSKAAEPQVTAGGPEKC